MPLTSLAINAHRAKYLVATFDGLEVSRRNGFSSCQNPLRSFPLIKNNDCSLEMRSHSWRRRNGIGTGIIIISLLSTFFSLSFSFLFFPSFSPHSRGNWRWYSLADAQGQACHLSYLYIPHPHDTRQRNDRNEGAKKINGLELVRKKHFLSRKKKKQKERNETIKHNISAKEKLTHIYRFDEKFTRESHSRNSSLSSFFLVTSTVS